jgi:hypothetical protein
LLRKGSSSALSHTADFSVGGYCEDEQRCHRSLMRELWRNGARHSLPHPDRLESGIGIMKPTFLFLIE